ncbi:hypothetical protein CSC67_10565 [Pusillimonas caeni]|uniref:hypothetical protein n=1 Tax=Pusillimonas caeni TaxID=1348472 RepID=UPI000E599BB5|nr:hypothetical protein [Pusillimonas caeni]TFL13694.1 hypothetical protein CSC67_10565 [Pusillimonas caeni]
MRYAEWVVCIIAGCVAGWLWGERPDVLNFVSALDVLSTLGTIGAALGAFYAARVALRIGLTEIKRHRDDGKRKSEFLLNSISYELKTLDGTLGNLLATLETSINAARKMADKGKSSFYTENVARTVAACRKRLGTPTLDRFWPDLKDLNNGLGVDVVYLITETKRLDEWLSWLPVHDSIMDTDDGIFHHSLFCADTAAEIGMRVCKVLRALNPAKSDRQYREYLDSREK